MDYELNWTELSVKWLNLMSLFRPLHYKECESFTEVERVLRLTEFIARFPFVPHAVSVNTATMNSDLNFNSVDSAIVNLLLVPFKSIGFSDVAEERNSMQMYAEYISIYDAN